MVTHSQIKRRFHLRLGRMLVDAAVLPILVWLVLACWAGVAVQAAQRQVRVSVDCSQAIEGRLNLWGHVNVSRRASPPAELCGRIVQEYGRPQVTRAWLLLDQVWDYRTGAYRFDYEISKDYYVGDKTKIRSAIVGTPTGLRYYRYLDAVSQNSDAVLLNIRGYEPDVLSGLLTYDEVAGGFQDCRMPLQAAVS